MCFCVQNDKELEQLEAKINPALDTNAQVALSYIMGKVVEAMRNVPDVSEGGRACVCVL